MKKLALVALAMFATSIPTIAPAHPGGLAADGCHNDRRNGGRHCHGGRAAPARASGGSSFANCSQARAAGRSNIRRGESGYSSRLDRDGDGIACER